MTKGRKKILLVTLIFFFPVTMFFASMARAYAIKKAEPDTESRSAIAIAWDLFKKKFRY
jgi:hypothetical protein